MSLTVSAQSQYLYSNYIFTNNDTYKEYSADASSILQKDFNISNLTNALVALSSGDSVDVSSIGSVDSYVKDLYALSQLDSYQSLSSASSEISSQLYGEAGAEDIYALIAAENDISADTVISSTSGTSSGTVSAYSTYLSESGSLLNLLL
ncbi:MAG: hypothetical protein VB064_06010 [Oscillospiraceae bacterium]|nr:hypothetical protein [Oscillospiraceae bacterium]